MDIENKDPEAEEAWAEFFSDEIDRERWRTNFGVDKEAAENAAYWRDLSPGIEPSIAKIYHSKGITPYNIGDWQLAGFDDYKEILGWHNIQAQPSVAAAFKAKGINPDAYEKWSKVGVSDPDTMIRFSEDFKLSISQLERFIKPLLDDKKIELNEVPRWLEKGFQIHEVGEWIRANFKYPSLAAAWKMLHFKPTEAIEWSKTFTHPGDASKWIAAGYKDLEEIKSLINQGYTTPESLESEIENVVVKM